MVTVTSSEGAKALHVGPPFPLAQGAHTDSTYWSTHVSHGYEARERNEMDTAQPPGSAYREMQAMA
jgi:hypothetical protein